MTTMNDLGITIGALPKPEKERRTVRVDLSTSKVYTKTGHKPIGIVQRFVENEANRTPTGGKYTSRRLTVRLRGDDRDWVGQFKKDEKTVVILRPLN